MTLRHFPSGSVILTALISVVVAGACSPASPSSSPRTGGTIGTIGSSTGGSGVSATPGGAGGSGGSSAAGGSSGTGGSSQATGGSSGGGGTMTGSTGGSAAGGGDAAVSTGGSAGQDTSSSDAAGDVPAGSGWAGFPGIENLSQVKKSQGCGMPAGQALGQWVMYNVTITPKPVRGSGTRVYFVKLPANYDPNKPYNVIFKLPGCGGRGDGASGDFTAAAGTEGVIQVGANPDPAASSVPGAGCFDDVKVDTTEPKFFETVIDLINPKFCFDQHRLFFTGHSSGGYVSNTIGCVFGSTKVRGMAPSSGALAYKFNGTDQPGPCKDTPIASIWSHNEKDTGNPPSGTENAIKRALKVNKCTGTFTDRMPYPAMGIANCEKFVGCPAEFPLVYCHPTTGGHTDNLAEQPARTWAFIKALP